jgi:hypothetical protein
MLRSDNSPLTVAFEDPLLRNAGLANDTVGEAGKFFELSDRQMHRLLCSCMSGISMEAGPTANRVRRLTVRPQHEVFAVWAGKKIASVIKPVASWLQV